MKKAVKIKFQRQKFGKFGSKNTGQIGRVTSKE